MAKTAGDPEIERLAVSPAETARRAALSAADQPILKPLDEQKIEELAQHFSEWTDDMAPLRIEEYRSAARAWVVRHG